MKFGMITLNQSIKAKQNYVTWELTALLFILKLKIFPEGIANKVEKWFDTLSYDENNKTPLLIGKDKKVIGLFKDELEGKIRKEFAWLRAKTYGY